MHMQQPKGYFYVNSHEKTIPRFRFFLINAGRRNEDIKSNIINSLLFQNSPEK